MSSAYNPNKLQVDRGGRYQSRVFPRRPVDENRPPVHATNPITNCSPLISRAEALGICIPPSVVTDEYDSVDLYQPEVERSNDANLNLSVVTFPPPALGYPPAAEFTAQDHPRNPFRSLRECTNIPGATRFDPFSPYKPAPAQRTHPDYVQSYPSLPLPAPNPHYQDYRQSTHPETICESYETPPRVVHPPNRSIAFVGLDLPNPTPFPPPVPLSVTSFLAHPHTINESINTHIPHPPPGLPPMPRAPHLFPPNPTWPGQSHRPQPGPPSNNGNLSIFQKPMYTPIGLNVRSPPFQVAQSSSSSSSWDMDPRTPPNLPFPMVARYPPPHNGLVRQLNDNTMIFRPPLPLPLPPPPRMHTSTHPPIFTKCQFSPTCHHLIDPSTPALIAHLQNFHSIYISTTTTTPNNAVALCTWAGCFRSVKSRDLVTHIQKWHLLIRCFGCGYFFAGGGFEGHLRFCQRGV